jgi:hypothetical protein
MSAIYTLPLNRLIYRISKEDSVPKPISWSNRLHEIRDRVERSRIQTWTRRDVQSLFEVKRASAQMLMRTIGGIQNVGGTHLVDRETLLEFLDRSLASEDLSTTVHSRRLQAGPPPQPKQMTFALPKDLRCLMADDLPARIRLTQGQIIITGEDSEQIIEGLYLLAQALQNDLGTIQSMLDPLPPQLQVQDEELRTLFAHLAQREQGRKPPI